jgi:hypothetical protein
MTVLKGGRRIEGTPENYGILACELLNLCWPVHPHVALAIDRQFTSPAQVATVYLNLSQMATTRCAIQCSRGQPTQYDGTTGRHGRRHRLCLAQVRRQNHAVDHGQIRGDIGRRLAIHQGSLAGYALNAPRRNGANKKRNPQVSTLHPVKGGESRSTAFLPYLDLRSVST